MKFHTHIHNKETPGFPLNGIHELLFSALAKIIQ